MKKALWILSIGLLFGCTDVNNYYELPLGHDGGTAVMYQDDEDEWHAPVDETDDVDTMSPAEDNDVTIINDVTVGQPMNDAGVDETPEEVVDAGMEPVDDGTDKTPPYVGDVFTNFEQPVADSWVFYYVNAQDNIGISYCNLLIDGAVAGEMLLEESGSYALFYHWPDAEFSTAHSARAECFDDAGNSSVSSGINYFEVRVSTSGGSPAIPMGPPTQPPSGACSATLFMQRTSTVGGNLQPGDKGTIIMAFTLSGICRKMDIAEMDFHLEAVDYDTNDNVPFIHNVDGGTAPNLKNFRIINVVTGVTASGSAETMIANSNELAHLSFRDSFELAGGVPTPYLLVADVADDFDTDSVSTTYNVYADTLKVSGGNVAIHILGEQSPAWGSFTVVSETCTPRTSITTTGIASGMVSVGADNVSMLAYSVSASNCVDLDMQTLGVDLYSSDGDEDSLYASANEEYFTNITAMHGVGVALGPVGLTSMDFGYTVAHRAEMHGHQRIPRGTTVEGYVTMNISPNAPIGKRYHTNIISVGILEAETNLYVQNVSFEYDYSYAGPLELIQ